MNRLEQEAADTLAAHEQHTKWRERALSDLALHRDHKIVGTWSPTFTEQQKREHDKYVKLHNCPF